MNLFEVFRSLDYLDYDDFVSSNCFVVIISDEIMDVGNGLGYINIIGKEYDCFVWVKLMRVVIGIFDKIMGNKFFVGVGGCVVVECISEVGVVMDDERNRCFFLI